MSLFDLIFLLAFFASALDLLGLLFAALNRRWVMARRILLGLGIFLGAYFIALISVSLLSPQRVLGMHQDRCFDEWCLSAEKVEIRPSIGSSRAKGVYYLVTVRVSSQAKRVSQRALDAHLYLLDGKDRRFDPSPAGQQALAASGQAGLPLDRRLSPGGSFTHTEVFDLPPGQTDLDLVVTHGLFPGVLIIGDQQSFLHRPTVFRLQIP